MNMQNQATIFMDLAKKAELDFNELLWRRLEKYCEEDVSVNSTKSGVRGISMKLGEEKRFHRSSRRLVGRDRRARVLYTRLLLKRQETQSEFYHRNITFEG